MKPIVEVIYGKIGEWLTVGTYSAPLPPPNSPAAKIASQVHAHVRNDAQIKFLYYPLIRCSY